MEEVAHMQRKEYLRIEDAALSTIQFYVWAVPGHPISILHSAVASVRNAAVKGAGNAGGTGGFTSVKVRIRQSLASVMVCIR